MAAVTNFLSACISALGLRTPEQKIAFYETLFNSVQDAVTEYDQIHGGPRKES